MNPYNMGERLYACYLESFKGPFAPKWVDLSEENKHGWAMTATLYFARERDLG